MSRRYLPDLADPLDPKWREDPPTVFSFVQMVWRQAWVVLLCIAMCIALALVVSVYTQPLYTARVSLFLDAEGGIEPRGEDATAIDINTHVELIRSDNTTIAVIEELGLDPETFEPEESRLRIFVEAIRTRLGVGDDTEGLEDPLAAMIRAVRAGLSVTRAGNTRILDIRYTATSPDVAVAFADAFANAHLDSLTANNEGSTERRIRRLEARAEEIRTQAQEAGRSMRRILIDAGLPVFDTQEIDRYAASLQEQLFSLNGQAASIESRMEAIENFKETLDLANLPVDTPESRRLVAEIGAAESRLAELRGSASSTPATLGAVEANIESLKEGLRQEVQIASIGVGIEQRALDAQRDEIRTAMDKLNGILASDVWTELDTLRRDRLFLEGAYLDYQDRLEAVRKEGQVRPPLRLVSEAMLPSAPSWPNYRAVLAIAGTLGLFLGLAIGAIREWVRHVRASRQDRTATRLMSPVPR